MKNLLLIFAIIIGCIFKTSMIYSTPINQYINTVSPPQNAVSVIKSSNITIVFTQDMNPATINNVNIKVFGYQTGLLPVTIDYNVGGKTANINPNQDLKAGEKISVTLTSGITTVTNENITPFIYTFYVKAIGGNRIFTRSTSIDSVNNIYMKCGDIDGDRDIDLIIGNKIFKNNGNAIFTLSGELSMNGILELGDFDNDRDLDILVYYGPNVFYYKNDGFGNFASPIVFEGGVNGIGDLNGDGYLDISYFVFTNVTDLRILKNVNGNFMQDTSFILNSGCSANDHSDDIIIDDMDNDGDMDIVAINGVTGGNSITFYTLCRNFYLLTNNGSAIFNQQIIYHSFIDHDLTWVFSAGGARSVDFNNDGFVDIAAPTTYLANNLNNTFSENGFLNGFCTSQIADINGDGFIDLTTIYPYSHPLVYINNSSGNFTEDFTSNTGHFYKGSVSADFDNDGDIDLAIGDYYGSSVGILLNGDIPLPVELSSFTSETESNNVTLNWSTSSEENNAGYDIERSVVRRQMSDEWNKTGFVQGNGNSNSVHNYTFKDKNLQSGKYKYRLKQTDFNGNFKYYELSNEVSIGIPDKFYLSQNYPNPFNPTTHLGFGISESGLVSLKVYDVLGNEVAVLVNENKAPGYYNVRFSATGGGSNLASGVYYYRLESNGFSQTKRMMLLK